MKREYPADPKTDPNPISTTPFSALHHRPHPLIHNYSPQQLQLAQHHHHQQQQQQQQHHQPFPFQVVSRDLEDDSTSGGNSSHDPTRNQQQQIVLKESSHNNDGASIEVQRRPRGRPPGSKNKPKPPVIITREPDPIMTPYILEVANGADVIDSVAKFSRRKNIGFTIFSASGAVVNVTIRQRTPNSSTTVTFHGRFDILSLSATFLHHPLPSVSAVSQFPVAISLSVPQGQIIGGIVAGPLIASGTVYIVAASFTSPGYHRLPYPAEEQQQGLGHNNNTASSGGNEGQSPSAASGGENNAGGGGEMYSCGLPSVIWEPAARQPY